MKNQGTDILVSVIVANHGRDTSKLRASLPDDVEYIEVNEGLERSAQRNMGIERSAGDILLILDSDQSVSPGLIDEIKENFRYDVCFYIPEIIVAKSFFGKVRKFEREFYTGTAIDVPRAVSRVACPMFDETMSGPEDSDWGNRIVGHRRTTKEVVFHYDDIGILEYFKKKAYYCKSMKRYAEKWPDCKTLNWKWRCFGVFVEHGKWRKLIRHPILSICIFLTIFVRGVIYHVCKG